VPNIEKLCKRYRIRSLSPAKLIRFITQICEQINLPKKLYQDLVKSDLFRQLPQNPIAAALISNLLSENKQELPSNLTELYSKSLQFMLGRWDEKKNGITTEKLYKACERLSRELARYMIESKIIVISRNEAEGIIDNFLQARNMGIPAAEVSKYLFGRSGIFGVLDDTDTIFFRHRSFAEYLYALDAYELRNLAVDERAFHPYWTNIFFFYVGLLAECPELLQQLVAQQPTKERSRWVRLFQLGNYLLAGYQSPYAVVEGSLRILIVELAQMYSDVKSGAIKSNLQSLSEMQLLWLFAMLSKHFYGYTFFYKALPLAMAQIDEDSGLKEETKMYALFFAACALGDLDDSCGYSFLLKSYKTEELPLPISIGLRCETNFPEKDFSKQSDIKKHAKSLKKLLTPTRGEEGYAKRRMGELFERPLLTSLSKKTKGK